MGDVDVDKSCSLNRITEEKCLYIALASIPLAAFIKTFFLFIFRHGELSAQNRCKYARLNAAYDVFRMQKFEISEQ